MPHDSDRRQDNRSAIELKVEYQRLNSFFYDYTRNISRGGTFIRTRRPLEVGTVFLFKLVIPTLARPLELRGEVRWIRHEHDPVEDGESPDPGMGIRFVFDDPAEREAVERTVEQLMVASLGQLIYSRLRDVPP